MNLQTALKKINDQALTAWIMNMSIILMGEVVRIFTAHLEELRPRDFSHILLRYSLILKCYKLNIFLNLHTIPHNDIFTNVLKINNRNTLFT